MDTEFSCSGFQKLKILLQLINKKNDCSSTGVLAINVEVSYKLRYCDHLYIQYEVENSRQEVHPNFGGILNIHSKYLFCCRKMCNYTLSCL